MKEDQDRLRGLLAAVRTQLDLYDLDPDECVQPRGLETLRAAVREVNLVGQAAKYEPMAALLPGLLSELHTAAHRLTGTARHDAWGLLAEAYRCGHTVGIAVGQPELSLTALSRMDWAAQRAGDRSPGLHAAREYLRVTAYLRQHDYQTCWNLNSAGRAHLNGTDPKTPGVIIASGQLHLGAAVLAARTCDPGGVREQLGAARHLAEQAGDDFRITPDNGWVFHRVEPERAVGLHPRAASPDLGSDRRRTGESQRMNPSLPDAVDAGAALRRGAMADALTEEGAIKTPEWRAAFAATPRHTFVPRFYETSFDGAELHTRVVDASTGDDWLAAIYSDQHLVIRDDVTSSSTAPSLMAAMLEALDLDGTERVLEIGTGTGYNAALLSERLGDDRIVTVDVDAGLVADARRNLAAAGYRPLVLTGDGAFGCGDHAPYDRIIATCAIGHVPAPWLAQSEPDGVIVAPLGAGVVRVVNHGKGHAAGRFLTTPAYFMPIRHANGRPDLAGVLQEAASGTGISRPTAIGTEIYRDNDARFWLDLTQPGVHTGLVDGTEIAYHPDGSWARISRDVVTQGGPRGLWDGVESAHQVWLGQGKPSRDRYGITIVPDRQDIWLDEPGSGPVWELPFAADAP